MTLRGKSFATWNHRVIFHTEDGPGHDYYAIHECHYDGSRVPHSWTEEPIRVLEGDLPALRKTLQRMLTACDLPMLAIRGKKLVEC